MFILLFVQNIDLEEIWLRKTNYFLLFHRVNSSHAKILPSYLYLLIIYPRLVVLGSEKLPLYFGWKPISPFFKTESVIADIYH